MRVEEFDGDIDDPAADRALGKDPRDMVDDPDFLDRWVRSNPPGSRP